MLCRIMCNVLYNVEEIRGELRRECLQRLMEVFRLCFHRRLEGHSQQQLPSAHEVLLLHV